MAHVLIVEDQWLIRDLMAELLMDAGFQVAAAATGDAALLLLQRECLDLIVTEIDLPGLLDGISVAEAARHLSPGIPIIFVSARTSGLAEAQRIGSPMQFLGKPFSMHRLVADVRRLIAA